MQPFFQKRLFSITTAGEEVEAYGVLVSGQTCRHGGDWYSGRGAVLAGV